MMPSVTVLVSSDTDIYISPGLYGDCLPTGATAGAADSFRAGQLVFSPVPSSSHTGDEANSGPKVPHRPPAVVAPGFMSHRRYDHRQTDVKRVMIDSVSSTRSTPAGQK